MNKRWVNERKAWNMDLKCNPQILQNQELMAKKLKYIADNLENLEVSGIGLHDHKCLFQMLSNDKPRQISECKKWRKIHPIQFPKNFTPEDINDYYDYCDFCPMMCYIALDDEGKLMYVNRTFPEDLIQYFDKK